MPSDDLRGVASRWFPEREIRRVERLAGGDVNDVYRVESDEGFTVLRVYATETTSEMVAWEHALLTQVARTTREAITPLRTADGATFLEHGGRAVSCWPFVEGRRADRSIASDRGEAARTLGRLHASLRDVGPRDARPGYTRWANLDWREHRLWSWSRADRVDVAAHVEIEVFEQILEELPTALRALNVTAFVTMPIHGDYYADNLLVDGEHVVAVLDWDECRIDWRAWETANAVWSFCRDATRIAIDSAMAREFLDSYVDGGGEVLPEERAAFPLLIRASRLYEAMFVLGEIQRGVRADWDYFEMNVAAIAGLHDLDLG